MPRSRCSPPPSCSELWAGVGRSSSAPRCGGDQRSRPESGAAGLLEDRGARSLNYLAALLILVIIALMVFKPGARRRPMQPRGRGKNRRRPAPKRYADGNDSDCAGRRGRRLAARPAVDTGFTPALAAAIACDPRYDLHVLIELVERGCRPDLAARILAPLDAGNRCMSVLDTATVGDRGADDPADRTRDVSAVRPRRRVARSGCARCAPRPRAKRRSRACTRSFSALRASRSRAAGRRCRTCAETSSTTSQLRLPTTRS